MPLILFFFSSAFIGGVARALLAGIGAGFITFIGTNYLINQLRDRLLGGIHGFGLELEPLLHNAGFYEAVSIILSAFVMRITISGFRALRF